jgi:DNA primase
MLEFLEKEKKDFIVFQLDHIIAEGQNDPIARAKGIKSLMTTLAHVEDAVTRDSYMQFAAQKLGAGEEVLYQELQKSLQQIAREKEREEKSKARREGLVSSMEGEPISKIEQKTRTKEAIEDIREREIARLLIQHGHKILSAIETEEEETEEEPLSVAENVILELEELEIGLADPTYNTILREVTEMIDSGKSPSPQYFTSHKEDAIRDFAIDVLTDPYEYSENWEEKLQAPLRTQKMPEENYEQDMKQVLLHFKHKVIEYQMKVVKEKLAESIEHRNEADTDKYIRMQQQLIEIRRTLDNELRRVVL